MGLRDTEEQLDACREQSVRDEARITELERDLAESDRELTEATSALAERMRHDAHGIAAAEADLQSARVRLAAVAALIDPRRDDPEPVTAGAIRRILDEVTAEPWGTYLDLDETLLAERACRHSSAIIRALQQHDPVSLDPASLSYAARIETLAERLAR